MTAVVAHKGISPRLLSPKLWGNAPIEQWACGLGGYYAFDDFRSFGQRPSTGHAAADGTYGADEAALLNALLLGMKSGLGGGYAVFTSTAASGADAVRLKQNEDEFGVIEVSANDADNDECIIQAGGTTGCEVMIDAGAPKLTIFEARLKKASIADNACAIAIGLGAPGYAAAEGLVDDTGEIKDDDFIGFQVLHADGEVLKFVYKASGQTKQVVIATLASLTADTYFKVGFILNPNAPPSKRITCYYNNTEQSTYITQTNMEAATFPEDVALARVWAAKVGAAAESKAQLDWWAVGQKED